MSFKRCQLNFFKVLGIVTILFSLGLLYMILLNFFKVLGILTIVFLLGPLYMLFKIPLHLGDVEAKDGAFLRNESAGLTLLQEDYSEAIVQIYAAWAWSWRGAFAEHTWIATKKKFARNYRTYQIKGWLYIQERKSPLVIEDDIPDRLWMGNVPRIIYQLRGDIAGQLIDKIETAVHNYPFRNTYRLWPGPNCNTFTAYIIRNIPELTVDLPNTAIGKDYLQTGSFIAQTPGRSGYQVSIWGLIGIALYNMWGIEINILGLNLKISTQKIELPGIGRVPCR